MRLLDKIIDMMLAIAGVFAVLMISSVLVAVNYEVVMRYFLKRPPHWVFEITQLSLLYLTFLGAAWVLKGEGHVKIDVVLMRLQPKTQALINSMTSALCTIACALVTWYGAHATWQEFQMNLRPETVVPIPYYFIVSIVPIGSLLLVVQFLRRTFGFLQTWKALHRQREKVNETSVR